LRSRSSIERRTLGLRSTAQVGDAAARRLAETEGRWPGPAAQGHRHQRVTAQGCRLPEPPGRRPAAPAALHRAAVLDAWSALARLAGLWITTEPRRRISSSRSRPLRREAQFIAPVVPARTSRGARSAAAVPAASSAKDAPHAAGEPACAAEGGKPRTAGRQRRPAAPAPRQSRRNTPAAPATAPRAPGPVAAPVFDPAAPDDAPPRRLQSRARCRRRPGRPDS